MGGGFVCQDHGQGLGQNEGDGGQKGGAGPLVYWGGGGAFSLSGRKKSSLV